MRHCFTPDLDIPRGGLSPAGIHRGYGPKIEPQRHDRTSIGTREQRGWGQLPAASEHVGPWGPRSESLDGASYSHGNMFPSSLERIKWRKPPPSPTRRLGTSTCTPRLPRGYGITGAIYHGTIGGAFPPGDPLAGGAAVWTTTGIRRPKSEGRVLCSAETTKWAHSSTMEERFLLHSVSTIPATSWARQPPEGHLQ